MPAGNPSAYNGMKKPKKAGKAGKAGKAKKKTGMSYGSPKKKKTSRSKRK